MSVTFYGETHSNPIWIVRRIPQESFSQQPFSLHNSFRIAICGYVWGKQNERIEIPITNERLKQTYYGAINLSTQKCLVQASERGDSEQTTAFLTDVLEQHAHQRLAIIWDGASYHRSQTVKAFLARVNEGLDKEQWRLTCLSFAPNDPTQNPIEDIWLAAKRFLRTHYHLCTSFKVVKALFEFVTHWCTFDCLKLFTYGRFSQLI